MHGILFKQLKTYVTEEWDEDTWTAAMDEAGIEPKLYLPVTEYPDDEAIRLVDGVVEVTDATEHELLDDLGEFMAPALLDTFKAHVQSDWDAMDLLARDGNQVFSVLRSDDDSDDEVVARREDADTVVVEYASSLEMCTLAKSVLRGLAEEHGTPVDVTERRCVDRGAEACEIHVSRS